MNDRKDQEIINDFNERKESAIAALKERYGGVCARIAAGLLTDERDREECLNDAYLNLWNAIPPAKPQSLRAYLYTTVRNLAISRLRAEKGAGDLLPFDELSACIPDPHRVEHAFDEKQTAKIISDFLRTLPADHRVIFVRRYYYCMSVREIAKSCAKSEGTVKSILSRTREKLKAELTAKGVML